MTKLKVYLAAGALMLSTSALLAADQPQKQEMSPQEKVAMELMMRAATPGDAHQKLASMVGTWDATVKMWNGPGAEPSVSTGIAKNTSVLGGRWIQEDFSGNFNGMPFSGLGYTGYDNVTKQYVATWMDTMSTGLMISNGTADGENTYTYASSMSDPISGKSAEMKTKVTVLGKDKHVMEMWAPSPDGKEFKMMEITYTRKK